MCTIGITEERDSMKEWRKEHPKSELQQIFDNITDNPNTIVGFMVNNKWDYKSSSLKDYPDIYNTMIKKLKIMKKYYDKNNKISLDHLQDFGDFITSLKGVLEFK